MRAVTELCVRGECLGGQAWQGPRLWAAALLALLLLVLGGRDAQAREADWSAASFERGYVLEGEPSMAPNPIRGCPPETLDLLDRRAILQPPPGGWPGTPQAVVVFNVFRGEVMISHGSRISCGDMYDARTRDSRFRAGVGQVVVPPAGNRDPILVAWQTPLRAEWVPTVTLGGPSPLQQQDTARLLVRAACMAVGLALALTALLGWVASRDRVFLFYAVSCAVFFVWQALINGLVGYPYPWLPLGSWLPQLQAASTLVVTGLMLAALWYLCAGTLLLPGSRHWLQYLMAADLLLAVVLLLLPEPLLRLLAITPQVLMVLGGVLIVGMGLLAQLRGYRDGLLGWLALLPFMGLVVAELVGARLLVLYRVEVMQGVATWLTMITAYAFNRRLGLMRLQRDEMRRLADTDGLTGLPNRRVGLQRLAQLIERSRNGQPLCIGFVDVDHFKSINDTYGHEVGDQVLVAVGKVMCELVRSEQDVVRMGGEEFLVMLPGIELEAARQRMEAIREQLQQIQLRSTAPGLVVTASMGVAQLGAGDPDMASLLRRADQAMYTAKQQGRNLVRLA